MHKNGVLVENGWKPSNWNEKNKNENFVTSHTLCSLSFRILFILCSLSPSLWCFKNNFSWIFTLKKSANRIFSVIYLFSQIFQSSVHWPNAYMCLFSILGLFNVLFFVCFFHDFIYCLWTYKTINIFKMWILHCVCMCERWPPATLNCCWLCECAFNLLFWKRSFLGCAFSVCYFEFWNKIE